MWYTKKLILLISGVTKFSGLIISLLLPARRKRERVVYLFSCLVFQLLLSSALHAEPVVVPMAPRTPDTTPVYRWYPQEGAQQYRIEISGNGSFSDPKTVFTSGTPGCYPKNMNVLCWEQDEESIPGDVYWRISSDLNYSDYSVVNYFVISTKPLLDPYIPDPTSVLRPVLTWTGVEGSESYLMQINDEPNSQTWIKNFDLFMQYGVCDENLNCSYRVTSDLPEGDIYWRVASRVSEPGEKYTEFDHFVVNKAEVHLVPYQPDITSDTTPQLEWKPNPGATEFRLRIKNIPDLTDVPFYTLSCVNNCTPTEYGNCCYTIKYSLNSDRYWWQVSSDLDFNNWSETDDFFICANAPELVQHKPQGEVDMTPTFIWEPQPGATSYTLEVADEHTFSNPHIRVENISEETHCDHFGDPVIDRCRYTPRSDIQTGETYWRVSSNLDPTCFSEPDDFFIVPVRTGDVNHSRGYPDLLDAILCIQTSAGMNTSPVYKDADVNGDEIISILDSIFILRYIAGLADL